MYDRRRILGVIPARGGSKGLPGKNVRELFGKPLIVWTIEQARNSKYLDEVIVSTDDQVIADISEKHGASVPFLRPKELATDHSRIIDVLIHVIDRLETEGASYDLTMLLQPTSPLRRSADIDGAIELLFARKAQTVVSVCEAEHHPYGANTLPADGSMRDFLRPEVMNKNRQELPKFYRINGAIYLACCDYLRTCKTLFGSGTYAYVMPQERSIDIDTQLDFEFAEHLLKTKKDGVQ